MKLYVVKTVLGEEKDQFLYTNLEAAGAHALDFIDSWISENKITGQEYINHCYYLDASYYIGGRDVVANDLKMWAFNIAQHLKMGWTFSFLTDDCKIGSVGLEETEARETY